MQSILKKGFGVLATQTSGRLVHATNAHARVLKRVIATDAVQAPVKAKRGWKMKALTAVGSFFLVAYVVDTTLNDDWDNTLDAFRPRLSNEERKKKPHIVILGAGWGALSMLRKLHTDQFNVTVVSPRNYFLFTPLLPSTTTGELEARSIIEPIRKYCERAGAIETSFIEAECVDVDPVNQKVTCVDNSAVKGEVSKFDLPYDYLVVSVGASNATFNIPGVKEYACFMKEVDDSRQIRDRIMDCVETAMIPGQPESEIKRLLNFVVVGGGPSGVEFTGDLHDFVKNDIKKHFPLLADKVQITLVEALPHILSMFDIELISEVEQRFKSTDSIKVLTNSAVTAVGEKSINIKQRETNEQLNVPYGMLVWATGNAPREVTSKLIKSISQMNPEPTQNSPRGLRIDDRFRVIGTKNIWAIGDCTFGTLPATAQVAGQQGRYLGRLFNKISQAMDQDAKSTDKPNLERSIIAQDPFLYKHLGMLAYIGDQRAIAEFRKEDKIKSSGFLTFFLWRSVYFSRLLSYKNRMSVAYDWFKAAIFGRDISRC